MTYFQKIFKSCEAPWQILQKTHVSFHHGNGGEFLYFDEVGELCWIRSDCFQKKNSRLCWNIAGKEKMCFAEIIICLLNYEKGARD